VGFGFVVDLHPPEVTPQTPLPRSFTSDEYQEIVIKLADVPAGLDLSTFQVICDGRILMVDDGIWTSLADGGSFTIRPPELGFAFTAGETIEVRVDICDEPDLCAPNCTTAIWEFYTEPKTVCTAYPNPFTPDNNNINDCVIFDYPHSYTNNAKLTIFNLRNIVINETDIHGVTTWFGVDNHGKALHEGLYLYIIESDGRVVCNGSVLLMR
jgi:hypothetical protein